MAQQLFKSRGGFNDGGRYIMSGVGIPGGTVDTDAALVGSLYGNTTSGEQYVKMTAGAGTANWDKVTRSADIINMVSGQSWREPVTSHDGTTTTSTASLTALNTNTFDGQTVVAGMRILFSGFTAAPNVYIVGGVSSNWTLTEDANAATSGDTLRVLNGVDAGQLWMFDGTAWNWIDALTNTEEQYLRTFVGKTAAGAQTPTYTSNFVVANGDSLTVAAGKLDNDSNVQSIRMAAIEGINTSQQTEIDAIETGAGLNIDGTYTAPTGTTYLAAAASLVSADVLLDAQIATNATNVANEITRATGVEGALQTELNTTQSGAGLNADGTYTANGVANYISAATSMVSADNLLDAQVKANADAVALETTNRTNADSLLQAEVDAIENGSGLNVDGTYTAPTGTSYLGTSTSISNATVLLDAQVTTNASAITTLTTNTTNSATNLQAELDAAENGAGLNVDGTYSAPAGTHYIGGSTSLANADFLLDAQVFTNTTAITNLTNSTTTTTGNLQAEIDAVENGSGLNVDGTFTAPTGTNYLGTGTSIVNLSVLLDAQVNTVTTNLATEVTNRTNAVSTMQTEVDAIETGAGLNIDGTYTAPTGTTYLGASSSIINAAVLLDTQISTNTTAIGNEITARTTADGNLQTQIGNTAAYSSTTVVTNGDAVTVAIGKLDSQITGNIHRSSVVNTTAAIVDSVLVDSAKVAKWVVFVNDTATPANNRAVEVLASHNGTAVSDATTADLTEYGELELGIELPITISVALNAATGAAQAMELSIASTSAVDVSVARMTV